MSNKTFDNKWVWICGASSGIGKALAIHLSTKGAKFILSARNLENLEQTANTCRANGAEVLIKPIDMSSSSSIQLVCKELLEQINYIDIFINSAGISQRSYIKETNLEVHHKLMQINYIAMVEIVSYILPKMIERKSGHIVGISSIVGKFGFPLRASYSASKHALKGYLETLYLEENDNGIDVSIVYPGRINTEISKSAITADGKQYGKLDDGQATGMDVKECADKIVKGISRKKIEIFVGKKELLLLFFRRFSPSIFFRIAKKVKPV